MDFLKKHYEKLILGLVLLGLAGAVAYLPFKMASERESLQANKDSVLNPRVKPLTNLDLSLPELALKRLATPAMIDFSDPNKLFNPRAWQKAADGRLLLKENVGPMALLVTNITPLYLKLSLDSVSPSDTDSNSVALAKYVIGVEHESSGRSKRQTYCKLNDKNDTFALLEVKGKMENPQLQVLINDTGEHGTITRSNALQRVEGYRADLRYDLEKKVWPNQRVGKSLSFNGEDYKIVAINKDEVVLSAPNQKKWTIKFNNPNTTP